MSQIQGIRVASIPAKGREIEPGRFRMFPMETPPPPPGAFSFDDKMPLYRLLHFVCPCGCGEVSAIHVSLADEGTPSNIHVWSLDGNMEAPTLTPSIFRSRACGWHGFLTAGIWRSV